MRITTKEALYTYPAVTSEYNEIFSHVMSTSERTAVEDGSNGFTSHWEAHATEDASMSHNDRIDDEEHYV
jgi:hypothetical protein